MRKVIITLILSILSSLSLLPRKPEVVEIHLEAQKLFPYVVEVSGPYLNRGSFTFYEQITIGEVLTYLGEPYEGVDLGNVDLKKKITPNMKIVVPTIKKDESTPEITQVNVNQASFQELIQIPYMTENRAIALLVYRQMNGSFQSVDDLIFVSGIGAVTLENIRPYIKLS